MTIPSTTYEVTHAGNSSATTFAFAFKFLRDADLHVVHIAADGTRTTTVFDTDYTITGAGAESGGNVSFPKSGSAFSTLATGTSLEISRRPAATQLTDFINGGTYDAEEIEDALDLISTVVMYVRGVATDYLEDLVLEADKLLITNAAGTKIIMGASTSDLAAAVTAAAAAATSATAAGTSATAASTSATAAAASALDAAESALLAAGISNVVEDTTPELGGPLDANSHFIGMDAGTTIASATPTVPVDGDYFDCSGTSTITAFTVAINRHFYINFTGIMQLTHHATQMDLPNAGANITTAVGDVAEFFSTDADNVQCLNYTKADGTAIVASSGGGPSVGDNAVIRTNATNIQTSLTLRDHNCTFTTTHGSNLIANRGSDDLFVDGDTVMVTTAGTLPSGLVAGTQYYVRDITSSTMKLSTSFGGAVQALASDGSGIHSLYQNINGMSAGPITIDSGTVTLPAGSTWTIT
jgi:hypothetical protein